MLLWFRQVTAIGFERQNLITALAHRCRGVRRRWRQATLMGQLGSCNGYRLRCFRNPGQHPTGHRSDQEPREYQQPGD